MSDEYKPNKFGTLLTFRKDVPEAKIEEALAKIAELCDNEPTLNKYDDRYGGPCFYIP